MKPLNTNGNGFEGSRSREGMACSNAQAQRAISTVLFVTLETLKTYENVNTVIQTRASEN